MAGASSAATVQFALITTFTPSATFLDGIANLRGAGIPLLTNAIATSLCLMFKADGDFRLQWVKAGALCQAAGQ